MVMQEMPDFGEREPTLATEWADGGRDVYMADRDDMLGLEGEDGQPAEGYWSAKAAAEREARYAAEDAADLCCSDCAATAFPLTTRNREGSVEYVRGRE